MMHVEDHDAAMWQVFFDDGDPWYKDYAGYAFNEECYTTDIGRVATRGMHEAVYDVKWRRAMNSSLSHVFTFSSRKLQR